jgi:hypothetical protein
VLGICRRLEGMAPPLSLAKHLLMSERGQLPTFAGNINSSDCGVLRTESPS